jgi:hypothetical protein
MPPFASTVRPGPSAICKSTVSAMAFPHLEVRFRQRLVTVDRRLVGLLPWLQPPMQAATSAWRCQASTGLDS